MKTKILILMTVSIIFLTAHFLIVPVQGQVDVEDIKSKLVIIEGGVDEEFFELDGYVIIQNNVNSMEVGTYEIVYQSLADGMLYTKIVEVISKTNKEYFNIDTCTIETFKDYPMILEKSVSLSETEQILMVRYITDSEKNIGHLYMYYIRNNEIIKEILLFYNQKIKVNDLIVDKDEFIVIGEIWNSLYANYDIVFVVCDKNGFRKCNEIIGGSGTDNGLAGVVLDDSYLVLGTTDSTDQIFEGNKTSNGFVLKIDKVTYEVLNVEYNKDYLNAKNIKFINDGYLKLLIIDEDTLYINELNEIGKEIRESKISFDKRIEILDVCADNDEIKIVLEKDNQVEIGTINSKKYQRIEVLNTSLKVKHVQFFNQRINVLYEIDNGCKLEVYDEEFKKIYEKDILNTFDNLDNLIMHGHTLIETMELNNKIKIHRFDYLKVLTMGKLDVNKGDDYHDYLVIVNGHKVMHNTNLSVDLVEMDIYGKYNVTYYFDSEIGLIMSKNINVKTICELEENGIYDKGLTINHNGVLYLNNQKIESGYVIEEEGDYVLELVGKNNLSKTINFKVKDLSIKPVVKEENQESTELNIVDIKIEASDLEKTEEVIFNFIESEKKDTININNQWDFMYMIPVLLTMGLGFIIIKFRY